MFSIIALQIIGISPKSSHRQITGSNCQGADLGAGTFFVMVTRGEIGSFFVVSTMVTADTALSEYFYFLHPDPSFLSTSRLVYDLVIKYQLSSLSLPVHIPAPDTSRGH